MTIQQHLLGFAAIGVTMASLTAQCGTGNQWKTAGGQLGVNGLVRATVTWDPDGSGPLPEQVIVAGEFTKSGNVDANNIAAYDPVAREWRAMGAGFDRDVYALAVLPTGELLAAGKFQSTAGTPTGQLARWNGATWVPFAGGVLGDVLDMEVTSSGGLLIAGCPTQAGGVPIGKVASWDGSNWTTFGSGFNSPVSCISQAPNGDIVAGGEFTQVAAQPAFRLARWNGASWSQLANGLQGSVRTLAHLPSGELLVGGRNLQASFPSGVSGMLLMWDGSTWSRPWNLTTAINSSVDAILSRANGDFVVSGLLRGLPLAGFVQTSVASWNGTSWSDMGTAFSIYSTPYTSVVSVLAENTGGDLFAAGWLTEIHDTSCGNVARLPAGTGTWQPVGAGMIGDVTAFAVDANGDLLAAGEFRSANIAQPTQSANTVARWDGSAWQPLGANPVPGETKAMVRTETGNIIIAGRFDGSQTGSTQSLQLWDGTSWSAPFPTTSGRIETVTPIGNGRLVAGGAIVASFPPEVATYDGVMWNRIGTLNTFGNIRFVVQMPNADLIVGGRFASINGVAANNCARWDGSTWSPLNAGLNNEAVAALVTSTGDLVVGGSFTIAGDRSANCIARWDGQQWLALGGGMNQTVSSLAELPNGDIVAGGSFQWSGMGPASALARWDGSTWTELEGGVTRTNGTTTVQALQFAGNQLLAAGMFSSAGTQPIAKIARLETTCPALVATLPGGCVGSAGANVLAAATTPWLGSAFTTAASGMPTNSLAVAVYGAAASPIPLAALLPQGVTGCDLSTTPDFLQALFPQGGTADSTLFLPNSPALAGLQLQHQVVAIEFGATGALLAATSTNALSITLGAF